MAAPVKKQAQKLRKKGRKGDTVLAHISPEEDRFLTQLGGGKRSKNPKTGLPEHFFGIDDAILGSILMSAGIGAVSSAAQGGNPLKGALIGGLGGALFQGIGGAFGKAGAGAAGAGATGAAAGATHAAAPIQGLGEIAMKQVPALGGAAAAATEPALGDMMVGKIKDFATSPSGIITGLGAIGSLTDRGGKDKKKIEEELERMRERDMDYPAPPPLNRKPSYAKGGKVEDDDYVEDMYASAYGPGKRPVGALEDVYADPYLFRGYTQDATGKQTELPPSYIPMDSVYSLPDIGVATQGRPNDIAAQIRAGFEQYGSNMLSRLPGISGLGTAGSAAGGSGIGGSSEHNFFPVDPAAAAAAKVAPPVEKPKPTQQQLEDAARKAWRLKGVGRPGSEAEREYHGWMESLSKGEMPEWYAKGGPVAGVGGGKADRIPAMLSDGEHVVTADEVSMLGDGSNREGQRKMYDFRKALRKHKTGKAKQMPKARKPQMYAGIGSA